MKKSGLLLSASLATILAAPLSSQTIVTDSFESGDMSAPNSSIFSWEKNNRTSVVTSSEVVYSNGETSIAKPSGRDWEPKDGNHSLRFRYPAGEPMAEQRFNLSNAYKDLWFSYWIKVPNNFSHPSSSPTNNKFFAVWMDGYSSQGDGPTVWWNLLSNGSGDSSIAYSFSEGSYTVAGPQTDFRNFIDVPGDRDRWMKVVMHIVASSQPGQSDGVIELWRRWENESSFTKIHETKSASLPIPSGGPNGWASGYIMGWANAEYGELTEWLVDDFTVATTSLLSSDPGTSPSGALPKPPTLTIE